MPRADRMSSNGNGMGEIGLSKGSVLYIGSAVPLETAVGIESIQGTVPRAILGRRRARHEGCRHRRDADRLQQRHLDAGTERRAGKTLFFKQK